MGWKVDKYGDRPNVYALFDPSGGVATTGTKEDMETALERFQPSAKPVALPTTAYITPVPLGVGDFIAVLYWHDHIVVGEDRGHWDVAIGTVVSEGKTRICYELDSSSLPERWGGDFDANDKSKLRFRSREFCFASVDAAKKAAATLPPQKKRA